MIRLQELPIDGVMTPSPACLADDCTLGGALTFLIRERYQSAPVADRDGRIVGLVTRDGLLARLSGALGGTEDRAELDRHLGGPLGQLLERPLRLPAETHLQEAARQLVEAAAPSALVTRGDEVVGIVTLMDCVRALAYGDRPTPARGRGHCFSPEGSGERSPAEHVRPHLGPTPPGAQG